MTEKKTYRIWVDLGPFTPSVVMEINVPSMRDPEEYIDELLDGILNEDLRYNVEWDFED